VTGKDQLRVGHLLRISGYLDYAIFSMWINNPRADVLIGMVEASLKGRGPAGGDQEILDELLPMVSEARAFYASGDFPPAMARMRTAQDIVDLRIVTLSE
jgi:hypothetical protein